MQFIQLVDESILNFIQDNLRCGFLDFLMPILTSLANGGAIYIAIAFVMLLIRKTRRNGLMLAMSLIIGLVVCNLILKPLVARPRPFSDSEIALLIGKPDDYSFPSGHTTAAFEAATVFMLTNKKAGIVFLIFAFVMAFSRLYLYVHFPSDVICGMIIGTLSGIISVKTVGYLKAKYKLNI